MKVLVTGQSGWVGRHVVELLKHRKHEVVSEGNADAMIHLAWAGLPNYESEKHFENVAWQLGLIQAAMSRGIANITVAGTCLEIAEHPPAYALAKLELYRKLRELPISLRWVRLPYLHGDGQPEHCLLPRLRRAIANGDKQFHVASTSKVFMHVRESAELLCQAAESGSCIRWFERPDAYETVADFCRRNMPANAIELVEDYPLEAWER